MIEFLTWLRSVHLLNAWDVQRALRAIAETLHESLRQHRRTIERAGGAPVLALCDAALIEYNKVAEKPLVL